MTGRGGSHAERVMALLADACQSLEESGDHAAAAHVGHAMDLVSQRHGVPMPKGEPPCGDDRGSKPGSDAAE